MTGPIIKFGQHNALCLESLVEVVIILPIFYHHFVAILFFCFVLVLDVSEFLTVIVVECETIHEEVMDFESIKFLLVFN